MDWDCPHLDHPAELVHLIHTLGTGKPFNTDVLLSCRLFFSFLIKFTPQIESFLQKVPLQSLKKIPKKMYSISLNFAVGSFWNGIKIIRKAEYTTCQLRNLASGAARAAATRTEKRSVVFISRLVGPMSKCHYVYRPYTYRHSTHISVCIQGHCEHESTNKKVPIISAHCFYKHTYYWSRTPDSYQYLCFCSPLNMKNCSSLCLTVCHCIFIRWPIGRGSAHANHQLRKLTKKTIFRTLS